MAVLGDDNDMIEVIGDKFDVIKLAILLRKNVGFMEIVTMSETNKKTRKNVKEKTSLSSGHTSAECRTER
ncbi:hypothetical protein NL676_001351 [Syzygium grande]|nr:hypothetical protein NL676_001351 [Syzygium grande]